MPEQKESIRADRESGMTNAAIAEKYGVSAATIINTVKKNNAAVSKRSTASLSDVDKGIAKYFFDAEDYKSLAGFLKSKGF